MPSEFIKAFKAQQEEVHQTAVKAGWWSEPRNDGGLIAPMHSERSEALEAELADVVIRIMDYAEARDLDIATAIIAKDEMNQTRVKKHGKEF